jgi:dTDP-4-dehydrorhamnose reductase
MEDRQIMRILITGGRGQLGRALERSLAGHELLVSDLPELDITDRPNLKAAVADFRPQLVIHAAAYTDVDGCARDPELAHRINTYGTQNVALACLAGGADLVHISTNEVFAGDDPAGYEEWRPLAPINAYGRSKAAAEVHVRNLLQRYYIVRTAWLYAPGGRNFVHAILDRARSHGELRVVADEIGNPTNANDLAAAVACLIDTGQYGTFHLVNAGSCSRWAFAQEILRLAGLEGTANRPIRLRDYPRPSTPPPFGALHNRNGAAVGITLRSWREALAEFMGVATDPLVEAGAQ